MFIYDALTFFVSTTRFQNVTVTFYLAKFNPPSIENRGGGLRCSMLCLYLIINKFSMFCKCNPPPHTHTLSSPNPTHATQNTNFFFFCFFWLKCKNPENAHISLILAQNEKIRPLYFISSSLFSALLSYKAVS